MTTYDKLDPTFKERWVKALRSGRYKQIDGQLGVVCKDGKRFCCLGVAACSLRSGTWRPDEDGVMEFVVPNPQAAPGDIDDKAYTGSLPSVLLDAISLDTKMESLLIGMNDDGYSFAQIADWIEKNL